MAFFPQSSPIYFASLPWCSTRSEFTWTCKDLTTGFWLKSRECRYNRLLSHFTTSLPACFAEANPMGGRGKITSKRDVLWELDSSSQAPNCCWHLFTVCEGISHSRDLLDLAILKGDRQGLCRKCTSTGDCQHSAYLIRSWLLGFTAVMYYKPGYHHMSSRDRGQNVTACLLGNSNHWKCLFSLLCWPQDWPLPREKLPFPLSLLSAIKAVL